MDLICESAIQAATTLRLSVHGIMNLGALIDVSLIAGAAAALAALFVAPRRKPVPKGARLQGPPAGLNWVAYV